jgi:hypothetical protein
MKQGPSGGQYEKVARRRLELSVLEAQDPGAKVQDPQEQTKGKRESRLCCKLISSTELR